MPCRAERNAVGKRNFGSAVSDDVSEQVCTTSTPKSFATSCTAKAPEDASASKIISQPSPVISSRATRAASWGWPLESRTTISIMRPPKPPAALNFSTSSATALREEIPSMATRPDRIVGIPIRMVLFCASEIAGEPKTAMPAVAAAPFNNLRRRAVFELDVEVALIFCLP